MALDLYAPLPTNPQNPLILRMYYANSEATVTTLHIINTQGLIMNRSIEDTMTPDDLEKKFKVLKGTQANWRSQGKLPYTKLGKAIIYFTADIEKLLNLHYIDKTTQK